MSDWFYRFGRSFLHQTVRLYYQHIEVVGQEKIPATGPAIVVANHPNSVTDAFLLASELTERKIIFRFHLANMGAALRFILNARAALRLRRERRRIQRRLRSLLAAYDAVAPKPRP